MHEEKQADDEMMHGLANENLESLLRETHLSGGSKILVYPRYTNLQLHEEDTRPTARVARNTSHRSKLPDSADDWGRRLVRALITLGLVVSRRQLRRFNWTASHHRKFARRLRYHYRLVLMQSFS